MLGFDLWQRRFGGDGEILGRGVRLAGEPHVVVDVMPQGFRPAVLDRAEVWRPMRLNPVNPPRGLIVLRVGAGLLVRSLVLLRSVDLGFNPTGVLAGYLAPPPSR